MELAIVIMYLVGAFMSGYVAVEKGRSGGAWILAAIFASPICAPIALAAHPSRPSAGIDKPSTEVFGSDFWARWRANVKKRRPDG
jgi:hypothetical protein